MNGEEYVAILTFAGTGGLFLLATFLLSKALRPDKPDAEKLSIYECGEEAISSGQIPFNSRFFIIALIFVLFETELIFLFPWAIVFSDSKMNSLSGSMWPFLAMTEMLIFVLILFIGLIYAWVKGHLDWIKPVTEPTAFKSIVPIEKYESLNLKYSLSNIKLNSEIEAV